MERFGHGTDGAATGGLAALKAEDARRARQYTIFLVDDDPDDRSLTLKELEKSPQVYNVQTFETGDRLMAHLSEDGFYRSRVMQKMPLLVLLDVYMPGTDGLGILGMLRGHPATKDIPVAVVTSDTSARTAMDARLLGASACISKPVRLADIHAMLAGETRLPEA